MSLTHFLSQSSEIRLALRSTFPYTLKKGSFPAIQAPPLTQNYAVVGQAFDYLLRFTMQRNNPSAPHDSHWIANWIRADFVINDEEDRQDQELAVSARPFLEQAHVHHEAYLNDGIVTDELLKSCLDLAIIDGIVRAGHLRGQLGAADQRDLQDLRNLFALIPSDPFHSGSPCVLNPAFSFPSGADCDLFIGNTLIEIKTTKFSYLQQDHYQQLLGYYLLNLNNLKDPYGIQNIGIYFSRHGYLWSVSIDEVGKKDVFRRFLPLWNEHIKRYHNRRTQKEDEPAQSIKELTAQVNQLKGVDQYMNWLSQLNEIDFLTWKAHSTAPYYVHGAIEMEEAKRCRR